MSRNGSGTYNLPSGNPVVTGTTISSSWANTTLNDVANALTGSIAADGQTPITGNMNLNNNRIINLTDPTNAQDGATKSYTDSAISTAVAAGLATVSSVITGSIQLWPTASAPTGYLLCNGSAVSRTTYAGLFTAIGTTFGSGDGSTTFNLPNYADRFPIGIGTIAATVGTTGGTKDAIVVSHTHTATVTDPGHFHSVNAGGTASNSLNSGGTVNLAGSNTGTKTTGITVANSTEGSSGTNQNLPPYLGISFIIKT
jgi:microcystin-dependent protein